MYTVAVAATMTVGTKPFFAAWEGKEGKGSTQRRDPVQPDINKLVKNFNLKIKKSLMH